MAAEEIELKLRVQTAELPRLRALLNRRAGARARETRLTSLYFDTPQLDLLQAAFALRVRRAGRRWVQTLKGGGVVQGGLHVREEQEWPVVRPLPDLTKLKLAAPSLPWRDIGDQLIPLFTTEFRRSTWVIVHAHGEIEVALDQGQVRAGQAHEDILELELELKAGETSSLYALALELAAAIPLAPDPTSKAERGYRLFRGLPLAPAKAQAAALRAEMSVEQAFIAIVWNCLDQMQRNQRGVDEESDPEFIHQMRVALRRMRSALSLFQIAVPRASWEPIAVELRWLAGTLGAARDWDVLEEEVLPPLIAELEGRKPLTYLPQRVRAERRKARSQARAAVRAERYGLLALNLERWLAARAWRAEIDAEQLARLEGPVRGLAEQLLQRRHRQLRRRGRGLAQLSDPERHRVRVAAKKLRYAVEFFAGLYPGKAVRPYLSGLTGLQDVLGAFNDAATTLRHAQSLCAHVRDERCREEAGVLAGWAVAAMSGQLSRLDATWKRYRHQSPFWG
jgi:inorganic triphosphatase YgiF